MVELVDSPASGAGVRKDVRVRLPPRAPKERFERISLFAFYRLDKTVKTSGFPMTSGEPEVFVWLQVV